MPWSPDDCPYRVFHITCMYKGLEVTLREYCVTYKRVYVSVCVNVLYLESTIQSLQITYYTPAHTHTTHKPHTRFNTHRKQAHQAIPILCHRFKLSKLILHSISIHRVSLCTHLLFTCQLVTSWWHSPITRIIMTKVFLHSWHDVYHIAVLCLIFHHQIKHNNFRLHSHLFGVFV